MRLISAVASGTGFATLTYEVPKRDLTDRARPEGRSSPIAGKDP